MKMGNLRGISILFLAAFAITGCADKTTQQYADQQATLYANQEAAIAGTYNGTIRTLDNSATIGGIQINLTPDEVPVTSPDGTTTTAQATLDGSVTIFGATTSEASFTGGYDPNTGLVIGTIDISDEGLTLSLNGTISGSSFSGSIQANQYPGDGGNFSTTMNATLPTAQGSSKGPAPSQLSSYAGSNANGSGCTYEGSPCQATLTVNDAPSTTADTFADTLVPDISSVSIVVVVTTTDPTYGEAVPTSFYFGGSSSSTAQEDDRSGTLTGTGPGPEGVGTDSLSCVGSKTSGWSCNLTGVATFQVAPSASAVK